MRKLVFILFFIPASVFCQTKQEMNRQIDQLKFELTSLKSANQALEIKIAVMEKEMSFLQKQIDELKIQKENPIIEQKMI